MRRVITRTVTTITTVTTTITWNEEHSLPPEATAGAEEPGETPADPPGAEACSSPEDDPAAAE